MLSQSYFVIVVATVEVVIKTPPTGDAQLAAAPLSLVVSVITVVDVTVEGSVLLVVDVVVVAVDVVVNWVIIEI